ncbi:MAG: hypothetical protein II877_08955 [Synergistaceae bacterium]|nr:hypothetical protein [Synergistaceae bacterium]
MRYKKLCSIITTGALIASTGAAAFGADYKTSIKLVLSGGSASTADVYDEAYTLVIPEALTITQEGWNSIGNMTASYGGTNDGFDPDKKLVVTAASTTGFNLTANGITDTIGYTVRTSGSDTEATTTFEFTAEEINTDGGTSKPIGVYVDSFSGKSNATYTDTITYTAEVQSAVTVTDISTLTEYTAQDGETITGTAGSEAHITVAAGATITLKNATINSIDTSNSWAGITCAGDATIILEGTNELKGGYEDYPGIYVPQNATLTIKGSGSLTASSNGFGAGIGGGYDIACGNIVIEGGNITATGGKNAAGIGSGQSATCGNITISGGSITATGGNDAAGIGGGYASSCGNITITDGVTSVTATKGGSAPNSIGAGAGNKSTCGTVTIDDGANVTQN